MYIARDKNGEFNAFILKPIRVFNGVFSSSPSVWSTRPFEPVWNNIPVPFINSLGIPELSDMDWEGEPVEIELQIVK